MAVLTGRVFMIQSDNQLFEYLSFNWGLDWRQYASMYANASKCSVSSNELVNHNLQWCKGASNSTTVLWYGTRDYDMPLLSVNPAFEARLQQMVPDGNIFHHVATRLFTFSNTVLSAALPYSELASKCLVGLHIRALKRLRGSLPIQHDELTEQFAGIAKTVARHQPGNVFVAADIDVSTTLPKLIPGRQVWWSNITAAEIQQQVASGSTSGVALSAFVDLFLLSRCKFIVLTSGSSFGTIAAGYSNVAPFYAVKGEHTKPFYTPYFWRGVSSEPHCYKLSRRERGALSADALKAVQERHPRMMELEQLHER